MSIADALAAANAILASIIVAKSLVLWRRVRDPRLGWIRVSQAVMGGLWIAVSVYLLITVEDAAQAEIGRIIARPTITLTLAVMAAGTIIRERTL